MAASETQGQLHKTTSPPCRRNPALMILCLLLSMTSFTACTAQQAQSVPVPVLVTPPATLYAYKPLPAPPPRPLTPRSTAKLLARFMVWAGEANADREAIRRYVDEMRDNITGQGGGGNDANGAAGHHGDN